MYYMNEKGERVYTLKVRGETCTRARRVGRDRETTGRKRIVATAAFIRAFAIDSETDVYLCACVRRRKLHRMVRRRNRRTRRDSRRMISFPSSAWR